MTTQKPRRVVVTRSKTERCVVAVVKFKTEAAAKSVENHIRGDLGGNLWDAESCHWLTVEIVSLKTDVITDVIRAGKKGGRRSVR